MFDYGVLCQVLVGVDVGEGHVHLCQESPRACQIDDSLGELRAIIYNSRMSEG